MGTAYLDIVMLVERLHRHFLDVLRTEMRRVGVEDINAVQALLLYNIGGDEVVIRDLKDRGYYQGSNVSYNIKKLTEYGYLEQERSAHDRRSVRLRLTGKGMEMYRLVRDLQEHLAEAIGVPDAELEAATRVLQRLERVWTDHIRYGKVEPTPA